MNSSIYRLLNKFRFTSLLFALARILLSKRSYLKQQGWFESCKSHLPVTNEKEPIPWWTYTAIDFLSERLSEKSLVFEYGSGYSTVWLARRCAKVVSVEHDENWFPQISQLVPNNVTLIKTDYDRITYAERIKLETTLFDVVIIDGRFRVQCAMTAPNHLKQDGIIIWDNADRERYSEGRKYLVSQGFKELRFNGMSPINVFMTSTSIFYRIENCVGL